MRKRITESNRWKKVVTAAKHGAAIGSGVGTLSGGLYEGIREHYGNKPKFEKAKPAFDLFGKGKDLETVRKLRMYRAAAVGTGVGATIGSGVGALSGGVKEIINQIREIRGLKKVVKRKKSLKG